MPEFIVTSPEGQKFRITAPEGASQEEMLAYAKQNIPAQAKPGVIDRIAAEGKDLPQMQLADATLPLITGAIATPIAGLAGLAGAALPGPAGQGASVVEKVQNALTYQPRTELGKGVTDVVSWPFRKLAEGANVAGEKTTDVTGSPLAGAAVNTAIQSLPMVLGKVASKFAPEGQTAAGAAKRAANALANTIDDAKLAEVRSAGYVVPPAQGAPGFINNALEGAGGKVKTQQLLSRVNQPLSDKLIRDQFEIAIDKPLNLDTLIEVRASKSPAYDAVRSAGTITADAPYNAALDAVAAPFIRTLQNFPRSKIPAVLREVETLREPAFDASSAIDKMRLLRNDADIAFRSGDGVTGNAYRKLASAVEDQLDRHLQSSGASPDVLGNFRDARKTIAQTYTVQKHLHPSGHIDAKSLARELKKGQITDNLETVAQFGANFPKAAQVPERFGGVPMSPFDMAWLLHGIRHFAVSGSAGAGASLATGNPILGGLIAAAPLARPGIRSLLASQGYQNMMVKPPSYGPGLRHLLLQLQEQTPVTMTETAIGQRDK